jgi:hypothetical protein
LDLNQRPPGYEGTYAGGTYSVQTCTCSGDFTGTCDSFPPGTVLSMEANLIQIQDIATGTIYLGNLPGASITGQIASDGELVLTGQSIYNPFTINIATAFYSTTPGYITGGLAQQWTGTGYSGNVIMACTITTLHQASPEPNKAAFAPRPLMKNPTLQDLIRALRIR